MILVLNPLLSHGLHLIFLSDPSQFQLTARLTSLDSNGTHQQLAEVSFDSIKAGSDNISSVTVAHDLRAWFDSNLTMRTHIRKTCASIFFYLSNIRHTRKFLSKSSTEILLHAFITSGIDYCNSPFFTAYQIVCFLSSSTFKMCVHV